MEASGRSACIFPSLTDGYLPESTSHNLELRKVMVDLDVYTQSSSSPGLTNPLYTASDVAAVAAWALTLGQYLGTDQVSFYIFSKNKWPTVALCELVVKESLSKSEFIEEANKALDIAISRALPIEETTAPGALSHFANTAVVIEHRNDDGSDSCFDKVLKQNNILGLRLFHEHGSSRAWLKYQRFILSDGQASNIVTTVSQIHSKFGHETHCIVGHMGLISQAQINNIWRFNKNVPGPWLECFHDIIDRHAVNRPNAPAIDAWDGSFTYRELVRLATCVAKHLQHLGVCPGVVVPISFERSAWAIIAMLAVSKAGGAFVSVPPYLPSGRRDLIIEMVNPPVLLTKSDYSHLWDNRVNWIAIECYANNSSASGSTGSVSLARPIDIFYIIFTSGSTGLPKGVMVSHSSFLTGALLKAGSWKFEPDSRVLQMLSHTFDRSLLEICTSLGSGACICVPRAEEVEESLDRVINRYGVTLAIMTPSLARHLAPQSVPKLKTLCLGGEALTQELVTRWSKEINLFQFYGPSECSIISSTRAIERPDADPLNIGLPNNAACWIVAPHDHNRLVSIGAIGELLVSGPIVGLGYFKDPSRTAQAFSENIRFLQDDSAYRDFCVYKTGDLARWNSDGSLTFCGRVDSQVKLNGQRLELEEVEYHFYLNESVDIAVANLPKCGPCRNNLVAVIVPRSVTNGQSNSQEISLLEEDSVREMMRDLRTTLQNALPRYMVPTIWAFVKHVPMSTSGKIDRLQIRSWVERMSEDVFHKVTGGSVEQAHDFTCTTREQQQVLDVWSKVLDLPTQMIGLNQPFIKLGGNSILAQETVARCRSRGIELTMIDIITAEGVAAAASLAKIAKSDRSAEEGHSLPRCAVPWKEIESSYNLSRLGISEPSNIEDIYPCTSMQVGMFLGQLLKMGSYHLRFFYNIRTKKGQSPDPCRIEAAWYAVVARHAALRTVIVDDLDAGLYHSVILRHPLVDFRIHEVSAEFLPLQAMQHFTGPPEQFHQGGQLHRLTACVYGGKAKYLMMEMSHAIIDGAALEIVMRDFALAFDGKSLPSSSPSYHAFADYTAAKNTEESARYWTSYLRGCPPCMIPVGTDEFLSAPIRFLREDFHYSQSKALMLKCKQRHVTLASVMRAAWALVLRSYTGSSDVSFAYIDSGRDIPVHGIQKMVGLCLSTQPCRARLVPGQTLAILVDELQQDHFQSLNYRHYPLSELKGRLHANQSEPMFNTAISMEWTAHNDPFEDSSLALDEMREQDDPTEYDLGVSVDVSNSMIKLGILYWPSISPEQSAQIARALMAAMDCFVDSFEQPTESLSLGCEPNVQDAESLNIPPLDAIETSILDAIDNQSIVQPNEEAILSWDQHLSYSQSVELASKVALYLMDQGVVAGDHVVACVDKSSWSIIILLGIMKSGAAFVAANPLSPPTRLRAIVGHCHAKLIVSEPQYNSLFDGAGSECIQLDRATVDSRSLNSGDSRLPLVSGADCATIVYTSGTTASPKGIVIDHGSLATSVLIGHGKAYKISRETKALQFSSFTFDASLTEIFATLAHGGCVCVPSEEQRLSSLSECMREMQVNFAQFTPTVARLIRPQDVPSLETLVLCGETMSREDVKAWAGSVKLYNGYGPSETTVCVSVHGPMKLIDDPTNIGRPVDGTRIWLTELTDDNVLAPDGAVGHLIVESRQVCQGYLQDREKTAAAFLSPAQSDVQSFRRRMYKTQDLAQRKADGSLYYVGRKDTQVKIRGQRVELGEVEYHLRNCLAERQTAVAEVITPRGEDKVILAAFLCNETGSQALPGDHILTASKFSSNETAAGPTPVPKNVKEQLEQHLPCYMVPSIFFNVRAIPITMSGKTDRAHLRKLGSMFSIQQLTEVHENRHGEEGPMNLTRNYRILQGILADVLNINRKQVGPEDSFFQLGGDSVSAMRFVSAARQRGMALTVADVFRNPYVKDLSELAALSSQVPIASSKAAPFALVESAQLDKIKTQIDHSPFLKDISNIEDIIPATDMQAFYVACVAEDSCKALHYLYLDIAGPIHSSRLLKACQDIVDHFAVLRTIFTVVSGQTWQVILHEYEVAFEKNESVEDVSQASDSFCREDMIANRVKVHCPFFSLALYRQQNSLSRLVLRLSHAQFDAISIGPLLNTLRDAYIGKPLNPVMKGFYNFVSHALGRTAESRSYWRELLLGSKMTQLASISRQRSLPPREPSKTRVTGTVAMPRPSSGFTAPMLVSAAWSRVLACLTGETDVVYGFIVAGRNAVIPRIEEVVGPCMNAVPTRVSFPSTWTQKDTLRQVRDQYISLGEADSLGFQDLVQNCTEWPVGTRCDSLLQFHDIEETFTVPFSSNSDSPTTLGKVSFFKKAYPVPTDLEVSARPNGNHLDLSVTADNSVLDVDTARWILTAFCDSVDSFSVERPNASPTPSSLALARSPCQSETDVCAPVFLLLQILAVIL